MSEHELYARSFADVYDSWYGEIDDPTALAEAFLRRRRPPATLVELGGGTGRLARPLSAAGFATISLDVSPTMLATTGPGPSLLASDMTAIAIRRDTADLVLIAYNTLFNLTSRSMQRRCLSEAARILRPSGLVAVEAFIAPAQLDPDWFGLTVKPHPTDPDGWVAIATATDADDPSVIVGSHIELRAQATACRPWRLAYQSPSDLDECAAGAGLKLVDRRRGWDDQPFAADSDRHVSWYRRMA